MSTELSLTTGYLMIEDPGKVGSILEANLGGEKLRIGDLDTVKIPTGGMTQWALSTAEGDKFVKDITGIVVHQHNQRAYYQGAYAGGNEKPDCSSNDGVTPYGNPGDEIRLRGDTCEECPLSQWGSKGNGQACRLSRRVYIVQPDSLLPVVISLSPTSVANMRKFLLRLGTVPYWSVVTRFTLKQVVSGGGIKYSVAEPSVVGKLSDDQVSSVQSYRSALLDSMSRPAVTEAVEGEWS